MSDFPRALRTHWLLLVSGILIGILAAGAVVLLVPVTYDARASLFVSAPPRPGSTSSTLEGAQLSQDRVKSYLALVTSERVLDDSARRLGMPGGGGELAGVVSASSPLDSVIIDIDVVDRSPERAAQIANTVGSVLTGVVAGIEPKQVPGGPPIVQASIVQPAQVPTDPSTTPTPVLGALGLLVGLVLGIGAALVRFTFDASVRSVGLLGVVGAAPVLGIVPAQPSAKTRPLAVRDDPRSPAAEAYRHLRANVNAIRSDRRRKVLAVTSPGELEGRTTTVANLALAIAPMGGGRVLLVDADLRQPMLAALFDVPPAIGLSTVLAGNARLEQVVYRVPGVPDLDVLPAGPVPDGPSELLGSRQMAGVLQELRARYELILVDTPPVLPVADMTAFAPYTDGVVMLAAYRRTKTDDVTDAVVSLRSLQVPVFGSVLTMAPRDVGPRRGYSRRPAVALIPDPGAFEGPVPGPPAPRPGPPPMPVRDRPPTPIPTVAVARNGSTPESGRADVVSSPPPG